MTEPDLATLAILVPVLGAFALPIVGHWSKGLRNTWALLLVLATLTLNLLLFPSVFFDGKTFAASLFGMHLNADGFAAFVGASASLISLIIVIFSFDYIEGHHTEPEGEDSQHGILHLDNSNEYYFLVVLFLGAMMGIVYASNLILLFIAWEITAITSWRLIGFFRKPIDVQRANKAFLTTVFGALLMLLGFVLLFQQSGSFDLADIKTSLSNSPITDLALILILGGILSKSATLPLHTWLPDAGVAPAPVTSLLHAAVLVKIGVYVFARLFIANFSISPFGTKLVLVLAATSALVSAGAALIDTDLKRVIAYSTVSQIAFILLGFATGTRLAVTGALLYILMHGLAKGGLFLCAGIVQHNTHTTDITRLSGLRKTMPVTSTAFLICALSVMGVPPMGGFFSKTLVVAGSVEAGHPYITATFVFGAVLTIMYLFRIYNQVFLGEAMANSPQEGSRTMVAAVTTLAVLSIVSGIAINWPGNLAEMAVAQIMGAGK